MTQSYAFDFGGQSIDDAVKQGDGFEPIDAGWYEAVLAEIAVKKGTKTNPNAEMLNLKFKVQSGLYMNRVVFMSITARGGSDKGMQWGRVLMGKMARDGFGFSADAKSFDPGKYLFKPVMIKVSKEDEKEFNGTVYKARNNIADFRPASSLSATAPPTAAEWKPKAVASVPAHNPETGEIQDDMESAVAAAESTIAKGGKKPWEN